MNKLPISIMVLALALPLLWSATTLATGLKLTLGKQNIDLVNRKINFKINRKADSAQITLFNLEGVEISRNVALYKGAPAGTPLSVTWPNLLADSDGFRLKLKVMDVAGGWVEFEILRFWIAVPHEEVVFETNQAVIRQSEAHKLRSATEPLVTAIAKIGKWGEGQLYIAGHTDTVGSLADNRTLSLRRARAIADFFYRSGVTKIPIYVRGFGEEALAVKTEDNTDELRNRRADYIVSTFPPEMAGPGSWIRYR
ncbi:MAG: OmpA family protein [Myxococcota bacterium]|jgi:outer membrane protein OmpA-like peptidoglycan-associated protein|nr:OmpA family protein [Myxococcota bacterium]